MKKKSLVSLCVVAAAYLCMCAGCKNPFFIDVAKMYEVTFSTNGGTAVESVRTDKIKEQPYTEKNECTFAGWFTASDFSGTAVTFPFEPEEDTTLYAKWVQMYTVSFETNGGTSLASFKTGIIESSPDVSKTDYALAGWYTSADFSGSAISFPYIVPGPITLYAKWKKTAFIVSFVTNCDTTLESYKTGSVASSPSLVKEDYSFAGWYTTQNFVGSPVAFPYALTEDTTLYARWTQSAFLVSFETNGGTSISSYKAAIIERSPETSRENYIFGGWYTDESFAENKKIVFPYLLNDVVTLYAKWIPTYNVSFETNGGSGVAAYRATTVTVAPDTVRTGYSFAGWYTDSDCTVAAVFPIELSADVTLYAKWQELHTVTFDAMGGSSVAPLTTVYIAESPATSKTDSGFGGWYTDAACTDENKVTFPYTVTSDITLYAKWTAVQCSVIYYANGATGGAVPAATSVDKGSVCTISANSGNLTKSGYAFTSWNTAADGSGTAYSAGSTVTLTSDMAVYAQWGLDYSSWENAEKRSSMIYVPAGSFYFGEPSENSTRPKITLSSYYIAQYELTYELWQEVQTWALEHGYTLQTANKGYATADKDKNFVPATNLRWDAACVWLNAYSEYKGLEPVYYRKTDVATYVYRDYTNSLGTFTWDRTKNGYRLPTECEWEFAAGGGSIETHDSYRYSGSNTLSEVGWYYNFGSDRQMQPVGQKKANSLGIYDMSGNASEWCYDYYASFGTGELTNPVHTSGSYIVFRGGDVYDSYSIFHRNNYSSSSSTLRGLRIARNAE